MSGRPHPPAHMRALLQEWKRGRRSVRELLPEARSIEDPSFAAEALFTLATDGDLAERDAVQVALEALRLCDRTERTWRRAEALGAMAKDLDAWRGRSADAAAKVRSAVVDHALALPDDDGAAAIAAVAKHVGEPEWTRLLAAAAALPSGLDAAKAVLRAADDAGAAAAMLSSLRSLPAGETRLRLLGAWSARMAATQPEMASAVAAEMADAAVGMPDRARGLDVVRAAVAAMEGAEPLHAIRRVADGADDEVAARVLTAVAARADRLGRGELAATWLREAAAHAQRIPDLKARESVQRNVTEGLRRMGLLPEGVTSPPPAGKDAAPTPRTTGQATAPSVGHATRHTLALVDAYEGGLGDVHLRAVARAAPLCDAFGFGLALVGFPVKDLDAFVRRAGRETNVGEGRGSLESLHRSGRLALVPVPEGGVPDLSRWGTVVATTPHPDPAKRSLEFPRDGALCVLVGLGPKGLPEALLKGCGVHLEVTGKGVSLETATAMGVIAERLRVSSLRGP